MNTNKLANLVAIGTSDADICDILGVSAEELAAMRELPATKQAVQQAKQERHELYNDLNTAWDKVEQLGAAAVIRELGNPLTDPEFALRAAAMANRMHRRAPGAGQALTIPAQQNNVVVIRLNQRFSKALEEGLTLDAEAVEPGAEEQVTSQGLPKHIDSLPLLDAEKLLIPLEQREREDALHGIMEDQPLGLRPRRTMADVRGRTQMKAFTGVRG